MSQRRNSNSSGRGDERSDLTDIKAMAAKARSETGRHVIPQNPAELSGVRPRRDSVVGMRLTPPPRTTVTSELPNWFWGALGCLSVLLVGFAGLFLLGRSGKLDNVLGARPGPASTVSQPAPVAAAPIAPSVEPVAPADNAAPLPVTPAPAHHLHAASAEERERAAREAPGPVADNGAPAAAAPVADNTVPAPDQPPPAAAAAVPAPKQPAADDQAAAPTPGAANPAPTKNADQPAAADDTDDKPAAKAPRAARAPATPKAAPAAADDSDDDQSAPGQDDVEAALDKLATRMRGCFAKYGIKGTARVRLVATPDGTADNVKVTGEFEDTPTGLCVESILTDTKLPTFKGPPLKISQSYQFR